MADNVIQFELVSPEKLIVSKPVVMVTVPGGEGDYGVLYGHAPMITTVKAGVIDIYTDEGTLPSDRIFVAGGFAEVTETRCTVLADEALPVSSLNRAQLDDMLRSVTEKIASTVNEIDRDNLLEEQAIVVAKLNAVAAA
jgi:F-type H+-transporting ATPase subunit epsilon